MKKVTMFLICLTSFLNVYSQENDQLHKEWEKMSKSKTNLYKDYNDLKFGMFIHWGVYSKLGGVYKGINIVPETQMPKRADITEAWLQGEWIMYCAQIPRNEYREVAKTFNPV